LVYGNDATTVTNVVVDHCDLEWSSGNLSVSGNVGDLTVQWTLLAEALPLASSGAQFSDGSPRVTLHHSLLASNGGGNPAVFEGTADVRNNVVFNWSCNNGPEFGRSCLDGHSANAMVNFVGNNAIPGTDSNCTTWAYTGGSSKIYVDDNRGPPCPNGCADPWAIGFAELTYPNFPSCANYGERPAAAAQYRATTPLSAPAVATSAASGVLDQLLARAGVDRPTRDDLDQRIIDGVRTRSGRLTTTAGPYPTLRAAAPPVDADQDGMDDAWERAHGLSPADPNDGAAISSSGYTNLERYLDELAGDPACR
jgi:hypothetical protein